MTEEHNDAAATEHGPEARQNAAVRVLLVVALSLVAVLLATTAAYYVFLQTLNRAPRTATERDVALWETAVTETPADPNAWANLAYTYAQAGRYDDAVETAQEGERRTEEPLLVLVRADVLRVGGRFQQAFEAYEAADEAVQAQMKRTAEQRREVGIESDLGDDSMLRVYFGRALSSYELGDLRAAIADLEKAAQLAPGQVNIVVTLGDYYAEAGESDKAEAAYRQALEYVPDFAPALEGLERLKVGE